jgi:UDP-N-acetylglucosamine--N-acetylmuramyl-(pentapeptide) pyrophosphoryl-undecaprenol N-acetylglucosamine transferase
VPAKDFPIEYIDIGGLKGVGIQKALRTLWNLPISTVRILARMRSLRPHAVFSMGGYVAGPTVLAALTQKIPVIAMEPNAVPGITNLRLGRYYGRRCCPFRMPRALSRRKKSPVFRCAKSFCHPSAPQGTHLAAADYRGSAGSRTLNQAARQSGVVSRSRLSHLHPAQTGRRFRGDPRRVRESGGRKWSRTSKICPRRLPRRTWLCRVPAGGGRAGRHA